MELSGEQAEESADDGGAAGQGEAADKDVGGTVHDDTGGAGGGGRIFAYELGQRFAQLILGLLGQPAGRRHGYAVGGRIAQGGVMGFRGVAGGGGGFGTLF